MEMTDNHRYIRLDGLSKGYQEGGHTRTVLREAYAAPVQPELIAARITQIKEAGARCAVRVRPPRAAELVPQALRAEPDLLFIQGTVVSAEHVSSVTDPLNLKTFIRAIEIPVVVGGCVSYQAALHLMRTGAAGDPPTRDAK